MDLRARRKAGLVVVALLGAGAASAADLFRVTATVDGDDTASKAYTKVEQVFDALRDEQLRALLPSYTSSSATVLAIQYRGMQIAAEYPASDTALSFRIDALGISEVFEGPTREDSRQQLRDYLKRGDTLGRIMALLASTSPVDPLAGNPGSLHTRMVRGRYQRDFDALAREQSGRSPGSPSAGEATASSTRPELGRHTSDGLRTVTLALPFSHAFGSGPDRPLSLDGELQLSDSDGARSYGVQLGLGYRVKMNDRWYLVPGASLGVTGSQDLGAVGTIVAASMTSAYRLVERADYTLWMGNALNWTRSLHTTIGDYSSDPKLRNWVVTNGLMLSLMPGSLVSDRWVELSVSDSRYHGSDLYDRRYDELGVALVRIRQAGLASHTTRWQLSYLDGTNSRGWAARVHVSF